MLKKCLFTHSLSANMKTCHILADVVVNLITSIIFGPLTIQLLEKTVTFYLTKTFAEIMNHLN